MRAFSHDLTEDYHLTLDEAKEASEPIDNMESACQRLQELRRRIKALGPINLDAISQYDEVNERLTFLNAQKRTWFTLRIFCLIRLIIWMMK